ncbi:hypothetical protein N9Y67_03860 [Pseudomonadota bacterium]|nr:hypothetical protein [Pseudomonadota bacterium]
MIKTICITAILLLTTASISQAEVVSIIDTYDVPNSEQGVLRPTRGMSMEQVNKKFGPAEHTTASVGEPPITSWSYPAFKVYFEHKLVIHSVVPQQ